MELQNTVKEALNALHQYHDESLRNQADRWLQEFQRTIDACQEIAALSRLDLPMSNLLKMLWLQLNLQSQILLRRLVHVRERGQTGSTFSREGTPRFPMSFKSSAKPGLQVNNDKQKDTNGEAESKYLSGLGIAQRQAIVDGLRDSVLGFAVNVPGATAKDVMDMVLVTQYFDTMKEIGAHSKSNAVFIPHGPGDVRDVAAQDS